VGAAVEDPEAESARGHRRRLARSPQPDRITQRVNETVHEILSQFPPKP